MALCHEFGVRICNDECAVAMMAGTDSCYCAHCGAICEGQFGGCVAVWASGRNGEGVEVDVRVAGPVRDAACVHAGGDGPVLDPTRPATEVRPVTAAPAVTAATSPSARATAPVVRPVPVVAGPSTATTAGTTGEPATRQVTDEVLKALVSRLAGVEAALAAVDRRLASIESSLNSNDPNEPADWALQIQQEVLGLRFSLRQLLG